MTIEEAINYAEAIKAKTQEKIEFYRRGNAHAPEVYYSDLAFLSAVISALREQEERERGCEYCTDNKNIYHLSSGIHDSMDEDVYISGNALVVDIGCHSYGSSVIKFCPMCGRRLPQPQKEDA